MLKSLNHPLHGWLAVILILTVVVGAACGGSTAPAPATAPPAMEPTAEQAATEDNTPVPPTEAMMEPTVAPTAMVVPSGTSRQFAMSPDWVSKGKYGRNVKFAWRGNPGQWDMHYCASLFSCLMPSQARFNQLVEYDPVAPTEVICDLCSGWEVNADGTVYTFTLREAMTSDGVDFTAHDVAFTLNRITDPDAIRSRSGSLKQFYEPGTARVLDDHTIEVPIKFPAATFMANLAQDYMKLYPRHKAEGLSQADANCCPENLVGTGPFIFDGLEKGVSFKYVKNNNYFKEGRPFFDGFETFLISDLSRVISSLKIGQLDATFGTGVPYPVLDMEQLERDTNGKVKPLTVGGAFAGLILHQNQPPFDDPKVRRAVYLALERQVIIDTVWDGLGNVGTFVNYGYVETTEGLGQEPGWRLPKEADLAEARRLVAEAGYAGGFEGTMNTGSSPTGIGQSSIITEQLRAIGLDFRIDAVDTATYHVRTRDGTHNLTNVVSAVIIPDPSDLLAQVFSLGIEKNPDDWSEPRFAELLIAQERELDAEKRKAIFAEMVEILRKGESHWVPVAFMTNGGAYSCHMQNVVAPPTIQIAHKWEHVWWDETAC